VVNIRDDDRVSAVAVVVEGAGPAAGGQEQLDLPPEPEPGEHPAP